MRNPLQPIITDKDGVKRFKRNKLVEALLDHGQATGLGLNELARLYRGDEELRDDWVQFAQLIGYSVSGFGDLSYVDDDTYNAAQEVSHTGKTEQQARVDTLQETLDDLREALREPIARLYGKHPDDLKGE